jgi:hypothetical protein
MAERTEGGHTEQLKPMELICVSAASKMVASTATYPHEVIRSYMHIQGTGAFRGLVTTSKRVRLAVLILPTADETWYVMHRDLLG